MTEILYFHQPINNGWNNIFPPANQQTYFGFKFQVLGRELFNYL
jgi:hypothetical protein